MPQRSWVYAPDRGGRKIPKDVQRRTEERIRNYAAKHCDGMFTRLDVRFRGALCYVDGFTEPAKPSAKTLKALGETREHYLERRRNFPYHLFRLRYYGDENSWAVAFYLYSHERYETSMLENGSFHGTPEEVFTAAATFMEGM